MCGIAGWFGPNSGMDAESLVAALRHRGPDGHGVWQGESATLVHTRLAIIDLSEAGKQPMVYGEKLKTEKLKAEIGQDRTGRARRGSPGGEIKGENRKLKKEDPAQPGVASMDPSQLSTFKSQLFPSVLVFNGEIYNHVELREEMEAQGEVFVGHSDTEVLLRMLVREGEACLPKLAGMFAFAFWDEVKQEALLARDAYGIKPLYYREDGGSLSFASETRVLKKQGDEVDTSALRDFFLWGSVPEPQTMFSEIRQIPAGHLLRWKSGKVSVERWHGGQRPEPRTQNLESITDITRDALEESMRRHLVSDVPVGIFLSGGIDSTVVLALARQALGDAADIRTFSIGFDNPAFDESSIAKKTAEHFGTRHTEWKMTPEEGVAEIPDFLAAVDQPSIDGFNTWCVSKLASREGMKVVLSGLGGDEWFAGYGSFDRVPKFHGMYRKLGPLRGLAAAMLSTRPVGSPWRRLAAFLRGGGTWLEAFHAQRGIFTADEAEQLAESLTGKRPTTPAFSDSRPPAPASCFLSPNPCSTDNRQPTTDNRSPREHVSELEVTRYMRNQLLRDSDVFSMAHGLELRVPLVDVRLAEALLALPPEERLRQGKKLLLDAVPEIPEWVRNQPKKGFRFPFQQWMEDGFGALLEDAQRRSPVPLRSWYRTWAVSVATRVMLDTEAMSQANGSRKDGVAVSAQF